MQKVKVEIESGSGFCPGVVNAIKQAEQLLSESDKLYCLGELVHNEAELNRLKRMGMKVIDRADFKKLTNGRVLIRAHGEPPETYQIARMNNIELVDATCRIVKNLQKKIMHESRQLHFREGVVVIYGKKGHPEVIGLNGNIESQAIVVEKPEDIDEVDFSRPVRLFSQTTMNPGGYETIIELCSKKATEKGTDFDYQPSVCGWMTKRVDGLKDFANRMDMVVFVAGRQSSNGRFLFSKLMQTNKNAYKISGADELDPMWLADADRVGVSGATSTPRWLLEKVAEKIKEMTG